jgi:transcriptional regulator with XRE-family HTH domain
MAKDGKKKKDGKSKGKRAGRPDDASVPFRQGLESLMHERGVSYRGLAGQIGLSAGYLNHLVHGNRPVPSDEVIDRIATALGVAADRFTEYRIRRIDAVLERRPALADRTYRDLCG